MENKAADGKGAAFAAFVGFILLLAADQVTKAAAQAMLRGNDPIEIIPGVFELHYVENLGAAFGILKNRQWIFIGIALLLTLFLVWFFRRLSADSRFRPLRWLCVLISAGAVGNMIDRLVHHFVVDFLYFKWIDFPVFNVADCYVVVGVILMAVFLLFYYKDEDWEKIFPKKSR